MVAISHLLTVLSVLGLAHAKPMIDNPQLPLTLDLDSTAPGVCNCTGTIYKSPDFICGDPRLGPVVLPKKFPLLGIVSSYDRFGGLTPQAYLTRWWDSNADDEFRPYGIKGKWFYPDKDGFLYGKDGVTVQMPTALVPGILLDRFGSEGGQYLAAAEASYCQRALPPSSLNTGSNPDYPANYHVYRVVKDFPVVAGVIAPSFGQTGLGAQFYIGELLKNSKGEDVGNVSYALQLGYITRVNKTELANPDDISRDPSRRCGLN